MGTIKKSVKDIITDNMMDYGAYVILQRAIPDLRDGLKPGARRILITMHNEKATKFTKSANIEGQVMKIHPHGSTYGTMVNMVQTDRNSSPLIIGEGNFSQATSKELQAAASRYTEVKLSPLAIEMLSQLSKNVVDYIPNFDGTQMMPEVLPVKFPLILTNAQSGVAYGMASSTFSFNLKELAKAMVKYIEEGKKTLLIPDFATRGYIINNKEAFKKINIEGSGTVVVRGKAEIVKNEIIITEVPYEVTREAIIKKVVELSKEGKLKEISTIKDLTGLKGMKISIQTKRGTDMNVLLEKLYQLTPLQSSSSANMNVLHNGRPKTMGVWDIIENWLVWRKQVLIRGYNFDIAKLTKQLHFFRGLEKVLINIDEAVDIIRKSSEEDINKNLINYFKIDEIQAEDIANMKLRNINKEYIIRKIAEIDQLAKDVEDLKDLVSNDNRLSAVITKELQDVSNKYGVDRKTKLIEVNMEKAKAVKKQINAIPNFPVKLFVTKDGYVKKLGMNALSADQYVKPGDEIVNIFETENHGELLVFGEDKACYKIKISDIEESTNKGLGVFIPSLCEVKGIVGTSVLDKKHKFIIIGYSNNKIAKIKLDSFSGNRKKLANSLAKSLDTVGILTFKEDSTFIFKTTTSAFKVPTSKLELKERWTQGIYGPRKGVLKEIRMV